ncbi:MAG: UDP-N-acetylglucosamine 2-epimerase (non-hydrolyzing), partial [Acidobacteria bacterium]
MNVRPKILNVVGARPNLMKIGPIVKAIEREGSLDSVLVHTGQHYDREMSALFFEELGIPPPDVDLGV